ncbi:hypothetical protein M569_17154 [Genlisea aurea]|uniref:Uncharacterized protein n=1 Tax=Genlisea aurea TaxID=192259 RepID=S8BTD8_9LAMI|nr:hypothetical protein M569_17154 [Genlisea aurea]
MADLRHKIIISSDGVDESPYGEQNSDQFEFWCVKTPRSAETPADRLFLNGKLLPQAFPIQASPKSNCHSQSTSRSSSVRSKDSVTCSRSNSSNSSSSARTSFSEACEKRIALRREMAMRQTVTSQYRFGSSGRWKLIAAAPTVVGNNRSRKADEYRQLNGSHRKSSSSSAAEAAAAPRGENSVGERSWKAWRSFVSACRECHSIETSNKLDLS